MLRRRATRGRHVQPRWLVIGVACVSPAIPCVIVRIFVWKRIERRRRLRPGLLRGLHTAASTATATTATATTGLTTTAGATTIATTVAPAAATATTATAAAATTTATGAPPAGTSLLLHSRHHLGRSHSGWPDWCVACWLCGGGR